jgi:ubiquinol-cytochrome c reductase iron-sulfur subunit
MSILRAIGRWLFAGILLLVAGPRRRPERDERELPANPRAELRVALLLFAAGLAGVAFVVVYALDGGNTQLLGVAIALALALVAAALILAGASVVPQETLTEERPEFAVPEDERDGADDRGRRRENERTALELREGVDGISRRRLLGTAGAAAGLGLGAAALTPLASLGPRVGDRLDASPWKDGTALVEENGMPIRAEDLEVGSYITAFADGADKRQLATAVVVVRVKPEELELPEDRADWAPEGLLAFSKICTHAQCAISLFRYPLFAERSPGPALVCPCHYSTFNVLTGGDRIFGPAVRALPQLPLRIESGRLVAGGDFSGPVGASWGGVREQS